ncbi:unnamed protein product [Sphenostylis stenocarpa]|uniref:Uncharacterized protein n=1 Tax=Sphenostylis stenocarpa TaxID=92480 RepID=A0AA86SY26_9FABA|nr:unnamed protein product [Sphenostylis stenocarpa]
MLTKSKDSAANHLRALIPVPLMHRFQSTTPFNRSHTENPFTVHFSLPSCFPLICSNLEAASSLVAHSRMRLSVLLLLFLAVLAATRPTLVDSRPLPPSPTNTDTAPHEPLKVLRFLITLVMTQKPNTNRVLIENQFHTMSSGPSRRGSGH